LIARRRVRTAADERRACAHLPQATSAPQQRTNDKGLGDAAKPFAFVAT
jgi:hypothetical protein